MHLGSDESKYFLPGSESMIVQEQNQRLGISICADSSRPEHPMNYAKNGVTVYLASVFLNDHWYRTDHVRFPAYAAEYDFLVLMANQAESSVTYHSVGRSAAWLPGGKQLMEVDGVGESLVIVSRGAASWIGEIVSWG